jgi:hypothetical protein
MKMSREKRIEWVLRIAVCGTFLAHGVLAIQGESDFTELLALVLPFSSKTCGLILLGIGILDVFLAVLVLFRPIRIALVWMVFWALLTAVVRPWSGLYSIWAFLERFSNVGAPLALLLLRGLPSRGRRWLS